MSSLGWMPGRPDFVFLKVRVVVFVDGTFWHGYRYPARSRRLSPAWRAKIEGNRARDLRNHRLFWRQGWRVLRIWEHQVAGDLHACIRRIKQVLREARNST